MSGICIDTEAELTERRKHLVSKPKCAEVAARLDIGRNLRLGVGEELQGGRSSIRRGSPTRSRRSLAPCTSIAVRISRTRRAKWCWACTVPLLPAVKSVDRPEQQRRQVDAADRRAACAGDAEVGIEYRIVRSTGPDHAPMHTVEVLIMGKVHGRGAGSKKKEAEQQAAQGVLDRWESVRRELEKIGSKL
jgi:ribonuclease-3